MERIQRHNLKSGRVKKKSYNQKPLRFQHIKYRDYPTSRHRIVSIVLERLNLIVHNDCPPATLFCISNI